MPLRFTDSGPNVWIYVIGVTHRLLVLFVEDLVWTPRWLIRRRLLHSHVKSYLKLLSLHHPKHTFTERLLVQQRGDKLDLVPDSRNTQKPPMIVFIVPSFSTSTPYKRTDTGTAVNTSITGLSVRSSEEGGAAVWVRREELKHKESGCEKETIWVTLKN